MNFERDLKQQFANWLSGSGYPADGDLRTLVRRYQNTTRRVPAVQRWRVVTSAEMKKARMTCQIRMGLKLFVCRARRGRDLKPYVSETILDADFRDLMFYDWGVYHFHLGIKLDKRGFIERTKELLFAIADSKCGIMYLIDIHPHKGGFTNQDLLRIIEDSWPEVLDRYTLRDIFPSYSNLSDEKLKLLRNGGITVALGTPGGRTLAPLGGGITTAKTSIQDVMTADKLVWRIRRAEEEFSANLISIERYFEHEHGLPKHELSFRAHLDREDTIWVVETGTGVRVWNEREGWLIQTLEVDL